MEVKLITYTPEIVISDMAKNCYANNTNKDLTRSLVHSHKHLAVLRFAFAVIQVDGISIACQNQVVRSKHLDFLVESKRYVSVEKGNFEFIFPKGEKEMIDLYDKQWNSALESYNKLISLGAKKEDARAVLPMNTSTKMGIAGNLQSWIDAIRLRVDTKAQLEIRTMYINIWGLLKEVYPNVFIEEMIINGRTYAEWKKEL
jgi:thymidylate synthase (FAD)